MPWPARSFIQTRLLLLPLACGLATLSACNARTNVVPPPPTASTQAEYTININTASEDDLRRLPHIGDKLAAEIVEFRTTYGRFHRPEQLLLLRGISEKRYRQLRPHIVTE